jgi:1-acyl-sn-glycerol-3-phosphate acyltransferase
MNKIRSVAFNIVFTFGSLLCSLAMLWTLFLPKKKCARVVGDFYGAFMLFVTKHVMGLKLNIEGLENLPKDGSFILAAKHQSAYETLTIPFMGRFGYPAIVHKESLRRIPLWGLYLGGMGQISIDRGAGLEAMRAMTEGCRRALAEGRPILIFPQGTRIPPGARVPYKAGIAKLYKDLSVPVVPLALNTGVFWGRNAFFKKPGTITYRILPPIPAGLPPLKAMEQIEAAIEEESDRLVQAAGGPALGAGVSLQSV